MAAERSKRLRVVAGPNGSGKSTIIVDIQNAVYCGPFVNADRIEQTLRSAAKKVALVQFGGLESNAAEWNAFVKAEGASWLEKAKQAGYPLNISFRDNHVVVKKEAEPGAYDAAFAADFVRHCLLHRGVAFTFETVMSAEQKIGFLREANEAGYKVYLYFVATDDPVTNVSRVVQRGEKGEHFVDPDTVVRRYWKSLELLSMTFAFLHRAYFFDNSGEKAVIVAELSTDKRLILREKTKTPWWVKTYVADKLNIA